MKQQRDFLIITNNPLVNEKLGNLYQVDFRPDACYRDILIAVRDLVYLGHALYTHPLSGSVKPNETPYKSVLVSDRVSAFDNEMAEIMSESLTAFDKFPQKHIHYTDKLLDDFRLIDFTLLCGALDIDAAARLSNITPSL